MTEPNEQEKKKPLSLARPGKLEIKKIIESGQVRQSFSHGRSKMVAVEVRKKRTYAPDAGGRMAEVRKGVEGLGLAADGAGDGETAGPLEKDAIPREGVGAGLTNEEKAARARALEGALQTAEDVFARRETPATDDAAAEAAKAGADRAHEEAKVRRQADEEEERRREEQARASASAAVAKLQAREEGEKEPDKKARAKRAPRIDIRRQTPTTRRTEPRRRAGKLTIEAAVSDEDERTRSLASVRRAREKKKQQQAPIADMKIIREVVIPDTITVQELASRMAERGTDVIRALMKMGVMASSSEEIDADVAEIVVGEFGHKIRRVSEADVELSLKGGEDDEASLKARPPVVTIMGHVDHGKTSLLDALRETDVAGHEAGGITQHIGAYQVTLSSGGQITFIDTPGHEAFTSMRARGAQVTDIVVLVVAADDSVMPQTVEAIHHAKAAGAPIIVAINKTDLPDADSGRVRTELLQHDLVVEEMGGDVLAVDVSAKDRHNLDKLEEAILLQAEILDLKANPDRPAEGVVIEAKVERGRGSVATVLVQRGTLRIGDIFVAGGESGRVRAIIDAHGKQLEKAGPTMPVEILGLTGTPAAGDEFVTVESESVAREVTEFRQRRDRDLKAVASSRGTVEQMFAEIQEGKIDIVPVVIKGDVHGSVEAIVGALEKMATDEVKAEILHTGVGGINNSDVTLAHASKALIIGFNVRANPQARDLARRDNVEIRYYSIIYEVTDDLRKMLSGLLAPKITEKLVGYAEIRQVFSVTKVGKVAGCAVTEGSVRRGARVRLLRDNVVIHEGELSQLKRFKDDAKEVKEGLECGMAFANYQDLQAGDMIECFEIEETARELEA